MPNSTGIFHCRANVKEEVGFTRKRRELNKMATVAQVTMTTIA